MNETSVAICPCCQTQVDHTEQVLVCPTCGIPHHAKCWQLNQGCTTFGCCGCISQIDATLVSAASRAEINVKDGSELQWVPEGEFVMSSDEGVYSQRPQRMIYLDGYWIGKHPVTVAQYRCFCNETGKAMPKAPKWGWIDDHPIVAVNWFDAETYCRWAGCRLPTEAEWEKAARGTDGRNYPWGNEWNANKYNGTESGLDRTSPVGSYSSGVSPYGCHDMWGNVQEWCSDWYDSAYYKTQPLENPMGPPSGATRVIRCSTSWCIGTHSGILNGVWMRGDGDDPNDGWLDYGFRLAR